MGVRLVSILALTVLATACDEDGLLPLSEYDSIDVNAYFYFGDGREVFLGSTIGASSCGDMAYGYAAQHGLYRGDDWSYICCTIERGSDCYRKIR